MEQKNNLINEIARRAIVEVLDDLYEVHRPIAMSHAFSLGVSSTVFAEARGVRDVAFDAISAAKDEAQKAINKTLAGIDNSLIGQNTPEYYNAKKNAASAARSGFLSVIDAARKKELLFLRDGTRSATVILAREVFL